MKKLLFLFFVVSLLFVSCEGSTGPMGPMGPEGESGSGTSWHVGSFTIKKEEWKLVGKAGDLNSYYYVDRPLSKLTEGVFREGSVIAYIETADKVKNGMPYVLHKGGKDNQGEFLWTQTYDFDFYPGGVGFYVTYSDFNTQIRPDLETFHVVLMW